MRFNTTSENNNSVLSRVLSCFFKFDLHGDPDYDVTSSFRDVTVYAIFASACPGIMSSLHSTAICS